MNTKPPLLLLHGVTMSSAAWDDVVPLLSDHFDLIVPTAAGHRGGPPVAGKATISALVDTTEELLDEYGVDDVHVAGNSMGGWMAIELARRGRARTVCALSPAGFWTPGTSDETHATTTLHRIKRLATVTRRVAPTLLRIAGVRRIIMRDIARHGDYLTTDQAVGSMLDLVECDAADDLLGTTESIAPLDPLPCPITLAWSEHDHIFPPAVNGLTARRRLPAARFILLPDVGHVPMIDDPTMCAQTILESTGIVVGPS